MKKRIVSSPLPAGRAEVRASWKEAQEAVLGFTPAPDLGAGVGSLSLRWWREEVKEGDLLFGEGEAAPELRALRGAALAAGLRLEPVLGLPPAEEGGIYEGTQKLPRALEEALEGDRGDLLEPLEALGLEVGIFYAPAEGVRLLERKARSLLLAWAGREAVRKALEDFLGRDPGLPPRGISEDPQALKAWVARVVGAHEEGLEEGLRRAEEALQGAERALPSPWEGEGLGALTQALEEALIGLGFLSPLVGDEEPASLARELAGLITRLHRALTGGRQAGLVARDREGRVCLRWGRAWDVE